MTSEAHDQDREQDEAAPATEELEEPSTEKEPGEEPKGGETEPTEPSHEAVGIGVSTPGLWSTRSRPQTPSKGRCRAASPPLWWCGLAAGTRAPVQSCRAQLHVWSSRWPRR